MYSNNSLIFLWKILSEFILSTLAAVVAASVKSQITMIKQTKALNLVPPAYLKNRF